MGPAVYVARMGERRCAYKILMGKSDGKKPLERCRRRWEEVGCGGMDLFNLAEHRERWWALVNAVMTIGFHKMREIFRITENRLASLEGLWSTE